MIISFPVDACPSGRILMNPHAASLLKIDVESSLIGFILFFKCITLQKLMMWNARNVTNKMALSHLAGSTLRVFTRNECYSSMFVLCSFYVVLLSAIVCNTGTDLMIIIKINYVYYCINLRITKCSKSLTVSME